MLASCYFNIIDISDDEKFFDNLPPNHELPINSLDRVILENESQTTELVQEFCNSLQTFTDSL